MPEPKPPRPPERGWTETEKGRGAPQPDQGSGGAGEALPKGRPTDDRAESESAAARVEGDHKR